MASSYTSIGSGSGNQERCGN